MFLARNEYPTHKAEHEANLILLPIACEACHADFIKMTTTSDHVVQRWDNAIVKM